MDFLAIKFNFSNPWLLLLLIPFLAMTVIPYFTLNKRYRKTRNRISSMVLHGILSVLCVLMLAGCVITTSKKSQNNEVVVVVDVSDSGDITGSRDDVDDFVRTVVKSLSYDNFKIAVVKFGYDQVLAVPFTRKYDEIYEKYMNSDNPDVSASNIADALLYAGELFTQGNNGKIVLVTDGRETDGNAKAIVRTVCASGISIDCAYVPGSINGLEDYSITSVSYPDHHIMKNDNVSLGVSLHSNYGKDVELRVYDNDELVSSTPYYIGVGDSKTNLSHAFSTNGLHEVRIEIVDESSEKVDDNNVFTSYYYLEEFNHVLMIEQHVGDSIELVKMMTENNDYVVELLNVNSDELPKTVDELCNYDEVILNNIANSDLSDEFVDILDEYVNKRGGGLFTVGGVNSLGEAHAYNRQDLVGTKLQSMLPVQAINYTPPVGVMIIIDRSGSMTGTDSSGNSWLDWARAGASSCLKALTERDYVGIMTLDSDFNSILPLTPRTQEARILSAIQSIDKANGGTVFPGAIDRAGQALRALKEVDKKHIIIVSDGQVPSSQREVYEQLAKTYYDTDGITISVVCVNMNKPYNADVLEREDYPVENITATNAYTSMLRLTKIAHGKIHVISQDNPAALVEEMREDLNEPNIKEVSFEEFRPFVKNFASNIFKGVNILNNEEYMNRLPFVLNGFNGVKVRGSAELLITGDYNVPIYAQWKLGEGMVGSFMCDLSGEWSSDMLGNEDGKRLLFNIINNLTPTKNLRPNDIKLNLVEENYQNTLNIYTDLKSGEYLKGKITYLKDGEEVSVDLNKVTSFGDGVIVKPNSYVISSMNKDNNYSRCKFVVGKSGVYTITIEKYNSSDVVIGSNTIYKSFAYSKEYDLNMYTEQEIDDFMNFISTNGHGVMINDLEDPHEVIDSFKTIIFNDFDPRMLFSVIVIILFLGDIAVRKFKFKWPHEIIRDRKKMKGERK